jgi:hypothetical protein
MDNGMLFEEEIGQEAQPLLAMIIRSRNQRCPASDNEN